MAIQDVFPNDKEFLLLKNQFLVAKNQVSK
jgi:hypothetical protein